MKCQYSYHLFSTAASILSPSSKFTLFRNPKFRNDGEFLTLPDFLDLAKNSSTLSGVLIHIEVRVIFVIIKYNMFKILDI